MKKLTLVMSLSQLLERHNICNKPSSAHALEGIQIAVYKQECGVELGNTVKSQLVVIAEIEFWSFGLEFLHAEKSESKTNLMNLSLLLYR